MKIVDEDMRRLAKVKGADGAEIASTIGAQVGSVLQKIVPFIDEFAAVWLPTYCQDCNC